MADPLHVVQNVTTSTLVTRGGGGVWCVFRHPIFANQPQKFFDKIVSVFSGSSEIKNVRPEKMSVKLIPPPPPKKNSAHATGSNRSYQFQSEKHHLHRC